MHEKYLEKENDKSQARQQQGYHLGSPRSAAGVSTSFLSANGSFSSSSAESSSTGGRAGALIGGERVSDIGLDAAEGRGGADGRGGGDGAAMLSSDTSGVS